MKSRCSRSVADRLREILGVAASPVQRGGAALGEKTRPEPGPVTDVSEPGHRTLGGIFPGGLPGPRPCESSSPG